jgi:DNA polymerase
MLVGEQPGDEEDRQGLPFVGPAGRLLRRALDAAGIDPSTAYLTNVVKHFKWRPAPVGTKRLHQKPGRGEVEACLPWLELEVSLAQPSLVVGLGATACQAMLGTGVRVKRDRQRVVPWRGVPVLITVHPSSILRAVDPQSRELDYRAFVTDLAAASRLAAERVPQ